MKGKHQDEITKWAKENYEASFGCSCIIECWDDEDYRRYDHYATAAQAIKEIKEDYTNAKDEQYANANAEW